MARPERVPRPTRTDEWQIVAADSGVAKDWARFAATEPNALAAAYDQLSREPAAFSPRQRRLEGKTYGTGTYEGRLFDRWQHEVTSGGRIFYFVDDPTGGRRKKSGAAGRGPKQRRRVIIEAVHPGHPKGTERKRS